MANIFAPFGFRQRSGTGSSPTYEQVEAQIDYNTAAIYFGDPVFRLSDGTIAGPTTGPGPGTGILAGIFVGCHWLSTSQGRTMWRNYWPGSDLASGLFATAYIINDPNAQFLAQVGGSSSTGFALVDIGQNFQFAYGTPSSSGSGLSGAYADESVARASTATLPFRVVSLVTAPPGGPGTASGAYNYIVAAFNNVETKTLTGAL